MMNFLGVPTGAAYHVVVALTQFLGPLGPGLAAAADVSPSSFPCGSMTGNGT